MIATLLTVATVLSLTACGKPFVCDLCGEEKTGKKYTEKVLGETITYCSDCAKDLKDIGEGLKGLGKLFE